MDRRRNIVCFSYFYRLLWVGNVQRYLLRKTIEEARGGDVAIDDDVELVLPTKRCEFSSLLNTPCTVWMRWGTDEKWKHKLQTNKHHHHPSIHPSSIHRPPPRPRHCVLCNDATANYTQTWKYLSVAAAAAICAMYTSYPLMSFLLKPQQQQELHTCSFTRIQPDHCNYILHENSHRNDLHF